MLDKPSILFPLNVYSFINIRYFKFKYLKNIYIFISNMDFLKIKFINILYRDWIFENFYTKSIVYSIIVSILFFLI